MDEGKNILFFPAIHGFNDTGSVVHMFAEKARVEAKVVRSNDSCGYAINLIITDDEGTQLCNVTMGRFEALCVADTIIKNLLNQEEIIENDVQQQLNQQR